MPREIPSRPVDVDMDLMVQLERRAELLLTPEQMMKIEADRVAVDIRIEVEDVTLDCQRVILVQRRANSDVRHTLERSGETLEPRCRHVDASARMQLIARFDVDRGESDFASEA